MLYLMESTVVNGLVVALWNGPQIVNTVDLY